MGKKYVQNDFANPEMRINVKELLFVHISTVHMDTVVCTYITRPP